MPRPSSTKRRSTRATFATPGTAATLAPWPSTAQVSFRRNGCESSSARNGTEERSASTVLPAARAAESGGPSGRPGASRSPCRVPWSPLGWHPPLGPRREARRDEERDAPTHEPARGLEQEAEHRPRALSRKESARSADLQRRYTTDYAAVVPNRERAKEAARVNVSALVLRQPRILPVEGRSNAGLPRVNYSCRQK